MNLGKSIVPWIMCIVDKIQNSFETGKYFTAVFLDVSQAFDKVWHEGLLHKIKLKFTAIYHKLLK